MEVKMPAPLDPQSNVVAFKKPKREGTLQPVRKRFDACKHERCAVDEAKREVTCRDCSAQLDAFQVLYELAHKQRRWLEELDEWDARRESLLSERYDQQWQEEREKERAETRTPPTDPELLKIWQTFESYFGKKFVAMYKRKQRLRNGPEWFGRSNYGAVVSFEYARAQLVPKAVGPQAGA